MCDIEGNGKCTRLWKQRNGERIRICDMGDSHIINTIKMLERNAEFYANSMPFPDFNGEMAQMQAENEWFSLQEDGADPDEIYPSYSHLVAEARRRGVVKHE